jgi:hypothetical protein
VAHTRNDWGEPGSRPSHPLPPFPAELAWVASLRFLALPGPSQPLSGPLWLGHVPCCGPGRTPLGAGQLLLRPGPDSAEGHRSVQAGRPARGDCEAGLPLLGCHAAARPPPPPPPPPPPTSAASMTQQPHLHPLPFISPAVTSACEALWWQYNPRRLRSRSSSRSNINTRSRPAHSRRRWQPRRRRQLDPSRAAGQQATPAEVAGAAALHIRAWAAHEQAASKMAQLVGPAPRWLHGGREGGADRSKRERHLPESLSPGKLLFQALCATGCV